MFFRSEFIHRQQRKHIFSFFRESPAQIQHGSKIWVRQFSLLQEKTALPSPGFRDCTIHFTNCKSFLPAKISPPDGISRCRLMVTNKTNRTNIRNLSRSRNNGAFYYLILSRMNLSYCHSGPSYSRRSSDSCSSLFFIL